MLDRLQNILACAAQIFTELFRVCCIYTGLGLATRLSMIIMVFGNIYNQPYYIAQVLLYGVLFDVTSSYIFALPLIVYKTATPIGFANKDQIGQAIYFFLCYTVILLMIAQHGLDLLVFNLSGNRIHGYLDNIAYYKQILPDILDDASYRHLFLQLSVGIMLFAAYVSLVFRSLLGNIDFKKSPTFTARLITACAFFLATHLVFVETLKIRVNMETDNRYIQMLPYNTIRRMLSHVLHKNSQLPKKDKEHRKIIHAGKIPKNVIVFLIEGLSADKLDEMAHLKKMAGRGIYFSNAFATSKILPEEIGAILGGDQFVKKKCNIRLNKDYDAIFFSTLTPSKSQYFAKAFSQCGFRYSSDNILNKANISDKNLVFVYMTDIKKAEDAIYQLITRSYEKAWFADTIFIILGTPDQHYGDIIANPKDHKVPIIFYAPRMLTGSIYKDPVSTIDIMPSVADMAGISYETDSDAISMFTGRPRHAFIKDNGALLSIGVYNETLLLPESNKAYKR